MLGVVNSFFRQTFSCRSGSEPYHTLKYIAILEFGNFVSDARLLHYCMECKNCNQDKPESEFYLRTDGKLFGSCKECTRAYNREWRKRNKEKVSQYRDGWNKTVNGYRHRMWISMNQRCEDGDYAQIKMTKQEWYDFATPLLEKFLKSHPDAIPSVDRVDPDGDYEIGNLRIIRWERNLTRSRVFLKKMGIDQSSPRADKTKAISQIIAGQCEALGLKYKDVIKELYGQATC